MQGSSDIPNILFHITRKEYVPEILKEGLIPNKNLVARFEDEGEEREGVYMTSDIEALFSMDRSFSEPEYAVLEVCVEGIKEGLIPDDAFSGLELIMEEQDLQESKYGDSCYYYRGVIAPSLIKHFGTVRSLSHYSIEIEIHEEQK